MIPQWIINFVDSFKGLMRFPPVVIDGVLYVAIAVFTALQSSFASDEAGKFMELETVYWLKTGTGVLLAGALSLKMFRSTSYSDHVKPKEPTGNTEFFSNPNPPEKKGTE